jgi:DNA-binding CsgD family transcriptional regulator
MVFDSVEWAEYYVAERLFVNDPFLKHPDHFKSDCFFTDMVEGTEEFKAEFEVYKSMFKFDLSVTLSVKSADCIEFFDFCASKSGALISGVFLNRPALLRSFAKHFKEGLKSEFKKMEEDPFSLLELEGVDFFGTPTFNPSSESKAIHAYLESIGKKKDIEMAASLSARERQCLKLLSSGKNFRETALDLDLSNRTVESYFENIKGKLMCKDKRDLIAIAKEYSGPQKLDQWCC